MAQTFFPHPLYRWVTLGCLLLTGLLGWGLVDAMSGEELFFFGVSAAITLWLGNTMGSRVYLDEQSIALYTPWRKPRRIQWRQVVSATEAGRFFHTLSLLYYPQQPSGLVDLERVQHLFLPTVVDQEQLLEAIEARILP